MKTLIIIVVLASLASACNTSSLVMRGSASERYNPVNSNTGLFQLQKYLRHQYRHKQITKITKR